MAILGHQLDGIENQLTDKLLDVPMRGFLD